MVGPKFSTDQTHPSRRGDASQFWQSDDFERNHGQCELCESDTLTTVEYGLRLCESCDRTYLP